MGRERPADIWDLIDLCSPWCVRVVATLRIADYIASGITQIDELAAAAGASVDSLYAVLKHLAAKGMFEEFMPGSFALNEPARTLLEPCMRKSLDLNAIGGRIASAWGGLLTAVMTGECAYQTVFGRPFWDDLHAHPDIAASFDGLMEAAGYAAADPEVLLTGGWELVSSVVDVGGGTGVLLARVLQAHPHLRGTLVDLPSTVARSEQIFQAAGVADRVTALGQSFFDALPAGADLYILKGILLNWQDRDAIAILRCCADAVDPAGRIVVLSSVLPDDSAIKPDLLLMVLYGGRYRRLAEFRELARLAGLEIKASERQASGRFVIECRLIR